MWIEASEQLPDAGMLVLAYVPERGDPIVMAVWDDEDEQWFADGVMRMHEEVTHWMDMPEPPEGM